jgi:NAD(P)-dependent dehydrogenase (short-subunit alcohol dehydrogenase family)
MMQNKQGVIITITSTAASRNYEYLAAYSASKAAAHSITMTAAKELSPLGNISTFFDDQCIFNLFGYI